MASGSRFGRKRIRVNKKAVLVGSVVLLVGLFAGLVFVLRNWQGSVVEGSTTSVPAPLTSSDETDELMERQGLVMPMSPQERQILNRHFMVVGGVNLFISMSSIRIAGDLAVANEKVQEVVLIKKGGDRERITIRTPEYMQVSAVTPNDKWVAYWKSGKLQSVEDLGPEDLLEMELNSPVVNELYMALQSGSIMQYLGQRDFDYKMSHVFEVQSGERHSTRFFIDPDTFLNIGREDRLFKADGTLVITRRIYSEHMDASGLTIPGKVETIINDVPSRTFHLHQAELNSGVLDSFFFRPEMPVKP